MQIAEPTTIILIVEGIVCLAIVVAIVTRRTIQERAILPLLLYVLLSLLWTVAQILMPLGWLDAFLPPSIRRQIPLYGVYWLALFFLQLSRSFLRLQGRSWLWWGGGFLWGAAPIVLTLDPVGRSIAQFTRVQPDQIASWTLIVGSVLWHVPTWVLTLRAYRQAVQPLHRNRITYWPFALTLVAIGGAFVFVEQDSIGAAISALSVPVAAYIVLTHSLPDVQRSARWMVSYLITTILAIALYTGGFLGTQVVLQSVPTYSPFVSGAAMALVLALVFRPLLSLVQRVLHRLISGSGYEPARIVREYSARISNLVYLEPLVEAMREVIGSALHVEQITLFLVRTQEHEGQTHLELERIQTGDRPAREPVSFGPDSPIARFFQEDRRPLTQYAVDLLPSFGDTPADERKWLSDLGMDVYVPICSHDEWLGLLALGAKRTRDRYYEDDLRLLSTLADQTAIALQNARLVEDLRRLNADLRRAYVALEQTYNELEETHADLGAANLRLQEVDRLKSSFISAITHELRTPFANLDFSLQLIEHYGTDGWPRDQHDQLAQVKTGIGQAKQMVDNLVTFASLLSKEGPLDRQPFDAGDLVETALHPLGPLFESKRLRLEIEIEESLPSGLGDSERLGDALYHLAHNACKFTPAGGSVRVRCRTGADALCFEVQDTGVGIPAGRLETLWESFAQMADPVHRGVEGLGLGLALVRLIVQAHGGVVYAESEEGLGSTFGFCIPLCGDQLALPVADRETGNGEQDENRSVAQVETPESGDRADDPDDLRRNLASTIDSTEGMAP